MSPYQIYQIGNTPYLFTPEGLTVTSKDLASLQPTVRYEEMRIWSFLHSHLDIHVVAFGAFITHVLGREQGLVDFLIAKQVKVKSFDLAVLKMEFPSGKMKKLVGQIENSKETNLKITANYQEGVLQVQVRDDDKTLLDYRGSKDRKSQILPDLEDLTAYAVTKEWSGEITADHWPESLLNYQQNLKQHEEKKSILSIVGCLVLVIILLMIVASISM